MIEFVIFTHDLRDSSHVKSGPVEFFLPASAGCTGLDPFRFFTGTVGTLSEKNNRKKH